MDDPGIPFGPDHQFLLLAQHWNDCTAWELCLAKYAGLPGAVAVLFAQHDFVSDLEAAAGLGAGFVDAGITGTEFVGVG